VSLYGSVSLVRNFQVKGLARSMSGVSQMWPVGHEDYHFILYSPHFDLIVNIRMCAAQHYFSSFKELKCFILLQPIKAQRGLLSLDGMSMTHQQTDSREVQFKIQ